MGVGQERTQIDGLAVRLDRLVEQPPGLGQEEIAQRLVGLGVVGVELRGRAELRGGLPAVAERLVDGAERVLGDHEVRVGLDGAGEKVGGALVGLLAAVARGALGQREQLERLQRPGGTRGLVDP